MHMLLILFQIRNLIQQFLSTCTYITHFIKKEMKSAQSMHCMYSLDHTPRGINHLLLCHLYAYVHSQNTVDYKPIHAGCFVFLDMRNFSFICTVFGLLQECLNRLGEFHLFRNYPGTGLKLCYINH